MYRSLHVVMTLHDEKINCFSKERAIFNRTFKNKYEKYRVEPDFVWETDSFLIPENKEDINDFLTCISNVKEQYNWEFKVNTEYEDEDFREAVAFLLRFPYGCEPYEDLCDRYDREELLVDFLPCDFCRGNNKQEFIFLSILPDISKKFKTKCMGISDSYHDNIISKPLYEELLSKGICEDSFRYVRNYHKKIVGYRFYGENCILPPKSLLCPGDVEYSKCDVCGREYIDEIFYEYELENIGEEFTMELKGYRITKEGLDTLNMQGVGLTNEYYSVNREVVINKQIYELMKEKWTDISKYVIPIFLEK